MCKAKGVRWIGPPEPAIISMGSKSASKQIMIDHNVPVVPGYHEPDQSNLLEEARRVGFPIMIKAILGGGGKGMRVCEKEEDFADMLDACKREAMKGFKDDNVLLERYITNPRHVEFQVFADQHGHAVHFHERDCSVQRRHQKVLEEAPSPGMTTELREAMGKSAVDAALAVGYEGAGTVEFILDADTNEYYFMEMNTRLQVEHPVTEMIMGRDLVQLQMHVAAGNKMPYDQATIDATMVGGHSIEARIYAGTCECMYLYAFCVQCREYHIITCLCFASHVQRTLRTTSCPPQAP
jgi:3-methylcrotonyl-CoA carboxylase alpha subunit